MSDINEQNDPTWASAQRDTQAIREQLVKLYKDLDELTGCVGVCASHERRLLILFAGLEVTIDYELLKLTS